MLANSGHGAVAKAGTGHGGAGGTIIEGAEAHDINSSALLNSRAVGRNLDPVRDGDHWGTFNLLGEYDDTLTLIV
jgi:hypothetical protein